MWTCRIGVNDGMKFYGCRRYKNQLDDGCGYFEWVDGLGIEVVKLKREIDGLSIEVVKMKREIDGLSNEVVILKRGIECFYKAIEKMPMYFRIVLLVIVLFVATKCTV